MRSIAFASALEKYPGDGRCCPPSDPIDDDLDLPSQDPVLRRQIFVSQQESLIDCSADIGEQARPKHSRASLDLIVEPGLYMLLRFQKAAVRKITRPETNPFQYV